MVTQRGSALYPHMTVRENVASVSVSPRSKTDMGPDRRGGKAPGYR